MENQKLRFRNYGAGDNQNLLDLSIDEDGGLLMVMSGQGMETGIFLDKEQIAIMVEYFKINSLI